VRDTVRAGQRAGVERRPRRNVYDLRTGGQTLPHAFGSQRRAGRQVALVAPLVDEVNIGAVEPDEQDARLGR
jgi:hypothetical protein